MTPAMYGPLGTRQIRLLRSVDASGLDWALEVHDLAGLPAYACLSYAWREGESGDGLAATCSVTIDGSIMAVKPNLHHALRRIGPVIRDRRLGLWVDALCINQEDLEERAEQVKMMKTLYERAASVYAWIGLPIDESKTRLGVDVLHRISQVNPAFYTQNVEVLAPQKWPEVFHQCHTLLLTQPAMQDVSMEDFETAWLVLAEMLKRTYWTRTWVHQEVSLPSAQFYCGTASFSWVQLQALIDVQRLFGAMQDLDLPREYMFRDSSPRSMGASFRDLVDSYENRRLIREGQHASARLVHMIRDLRLTSCGDPRDKVFAALPHATDVKQSASFLKVSYEVSVEELYINVARSSLLSGPQLEVLGYVCKPDDAANTTVPSWVPDWRIQNRIRPLNNSDIHHASYHMLYEPCPGTAVEYNVVGNELHIKGIIFDTITFVTAETGHELSPFELRKWETDLQAFDPSIPVEDIRRTLVADAQYSLRNEENSRGNSVDWELIARSPHALDLKTTSERRHMLQSMRAAVRHRRSGVTMRGRPSILPEHARVGDRVAAFYGGRALYVIRREGDKWRFVGECYVDLMMDGQVMEVAEREGMRHEVAVLV